MHKLLTVWLFISSPFWLSACYESVNVTLHEPGEYKGHEDPLLSKMKQQQLQEKLDERFKVSQSDR